MRFGWSSTRITNLHNFSPDRLFFPWIFQRILVFVYDEYWFARYDCRILEIYVSLLWLCWTYGNIRSLIVARLVLSTNKSHTSGRIVASDNPIVWMGFKSLVHSLDIVEIIATYASAVSTSWLVNSFVLGKHNEFSRPWSANCVCLYDYDYIVCVNQASHWCNTKSVDKLRVFD